MSAIKGSSSYLRFLATGQPAGLDAIDQAVEARRFLPLHAEGESLESAGWVPFEDPFADERPITRDTFAFGHIIAVTYREDRFAIPRPIVKRAVKERLDKIEREEGKDRKEMGKGFIKAVEQAVFVEIKSKTFPRSRLVEVIWDTQRNEVRVFGRGTIATERVASLFERTFQVRLELGVYAARAFSLPMPTRNRDILNGLAPSIIVGAPTRKEAA